MKVPAPGDSALIILPPKAIGERIDRWRRVYDPNQHTIPPHITLVYPPFVPQEAWDDLRAPIAALLADFQPFTVTLRTTEVFMARPAVLWLRPEEDGVIARLHAAITAQFPEHALPLPFDYVPHLTVGFFATPEALAEARQVITAELTPFHFRVDRVAYAVLDHDGAWCHCDELPLGSLPAALMVDVGSASDRSSAEAPGQRGEHPWPAPIDADASRRRSGPPPWLLGGLLLAIVIVPSLIWRGELAGLFTDRDRVMALVRDADAWGPAALMGLTVAQIIAAPIPGQAVNLVAGYAFGFWRGALYSWLATLIGSTAALALARYAGRPLVVRLVSPHALDRLDRYAAGRGLGFFFLVFLIPFLPDDVACFLAGLTPLPLRALVAVVALGRIPGVLTAVWAGSQADRLGWQGWLVAGAAIVLGLFVAIRYGRRLQDALLQWLSQRTRS